MFLIESLETLLGAEDKEILKALHYVKKPPVKRISYIDILHPSGIPMEVTDDVIEGKWSVVFDQAENRLWSEAAILATLI
ncbi:MAG: hypothetical protein ACP5K2_09250 [bacterium]